MTTPRAITVNTIVIDPQGSATGNSTVRLFDVPPDAAAAIVLGGPALPLATTTPGQNARLTFTGVAGRRASLSLAPTCCATAISVLAPDGAEVADDSSITTTGLFRRHIVRRAYYYPRRRTGLFCRGFGVDRSGVRVDQFGYPEIEDLYDPVGADHEVVRLNVPVDNVGAVCGLEGARDLNR